MLYLKTSKEYNLETTNNFQAIRPFPDPSFPFILDHLRMSELSISHVAWHWHDEMELLFIRQGTLMVTTTMLTCTLTAGEGLFINSGIAHTMKTEPLEDCEFYSLRFLSRLLFPDKNTSLAAQYLLPLLMNKSFKQLPLYLEDDSQKNILDILQNITTICSMEEYGCELKILSNLYALWGELNAHAKQYVTNAILTNSVIADHGRVINAIHYIANHYAEPLTLEEIAESIHLSKSECCRCFKRTIHLSPIEFLIQYRIMEALRRIQVNDSIASSIADLSSVVGFNSPSYFNKQFKRYIKCTPLEYRKKLLSDTSETSFEKEFRNILK